MDYSERGERDTPLTNTTSSTASLATNDFNKNVIQSINQNSSTHINIQIVKLKLHFNQL